MRYTLTILLFTLSLTLCCAQTMREALRTMPDTIVPLLTKNNMLDFPDYLDTQMKAEVRNRLGGTSEMTILTDDYTEVRVSDASTLQLKLLPYKGNKVILSVYTYLLNDSTGDSQLRFYDLQWNPLNADKFINVSRDDANSLIQIKASALNTDLTVQTSYPLRICPEGEKPKESADSKTTMKWNGKMFK